MSLLAGGVTELMVVKMQLLPGVGSVMVHCLYGACSPWTFQRVGATARNERHEKHLSSDSD